MMIRTRWTAYLLLLSLSSDIHGLLPQRQPFRAVPAIVGDTVLLRAPQMSDHAEWSALRGTSRDFLTPWEPIWPADDLTRAAFRRRIRRYAEDQRSDLAYPFFVYRKTDNVLVGGLTLSNVRRGCAQAASLGYWMGAPMRGKVT